MGGECGEVLLDALGVADVRQHTVKDGDLAALCCRNQHATHCHEGEQTGSFQGNGFTAGVRTGNDESAALAAQREADGDGFLVGNQGVTCLFQDEYAVIGQIRRKGVHLLRQTCLCEIEVQLGAGFVIANDGVCPGAAVRAKLLNDALDLLRLLNLQQTDVVVCFDHSDRLNEEGLPGSGGVMYQTGNLAPMLGTHRQNKPPVTQGDTAVL